MSAKNALMRSRLEAIIQQEKIEVMPIVPAMLNVFWQIEGAKKEDEEPGAVWCCGDMTA